MSEILKSKGKGSILVIIGIIMCGVGVYRGEVNVVLAKSVKICMECIGIG